MQRKSFLIGEIRQKKIIKRWNLYKSKDFHWCLFMGHLVIEKLLKAVYVSKFFSYPPRIHNLLRLAEKSNLQISEEQANELDMLTTFNINARYPDYKQSIYRKSTEAFTAKHIEKIKELRTCLHSELDKI
ncbi:HEPN domain-containing protein [Salicibibacter kimchii]|uniref:HEPN domain-containing protein n=1 Tax=Salicibibacter kimchii TaxID=2099786 RepID=UPI003AB05690